MDRRPPEDRRPFDDRPRRDPPSWSDSPPAARDEAGEGHRQASEWQRPDAPRRGPRPDYRQSIVPRVAAAPAPPLEDGEELIAGRRPVEEAFAAGRPPRRLLVTPQRRQALEKIVLHATTLRIPIVEVEGGSLTSLAGFDGHQGIAVVVDARRFASLEDILARAIEHKEAPFAIVLDSLEDPQNVGTLLRSAEAAGVHGVVFPTERQAPLSPAAIKASAGATEHLLLAPVDDLPGALTDLHLRGLRIVGSDAEAPLTAREADLRGPIAIVVGSEGHGLSPAVRRRCDLFVRIPMRGQIGSLNAAVAGSILAFEALGQRDPGAKPAVTRAPSRSRAPRDEPEPPWDSDAAPSPDEAAPPPDEAAAPAEIDTRATGVIDILEGDSAPEADSGRDADTAPEAGATLATSATEGVAAAVEALAAPAPASSAKRAATTKRAAPTKRAAKATAAEPGDEDDAAPRADPTTSAFASVVKPAPKKKPRKRREIVSLAPGAEALESQAAPAQDAAAEDLLPDDTAKAARPRRKRA
jgi:23S rRNA (guanosine2251-2'-O)-methyltransferase